MAKEYTLGGINITVAAHVPLSLIMIMPTAAPNVQIEIYRAWCGQNANATSAQQQIETTTQVAAFPTTAVSTTPAPLKRTDTVASLIAGNATIAAGKCGINVGTEGAGTKTSIFGDCFNVLNGYLWVPTPAEVLVFPAGSLSAYDLQFSTTQPGTLTGWTFGCNFAER